jgi:hypothetical protein
MAIDKHLTLPESDAIIGYADPLIGRIARRDVAGYFGFPLIKSGQPVTPAILDKAQSLGRLFELTAATDDV